MQDRYGLDLSTTSSEARDAYIAGVDLALSANQGAEERFRCAIACDEGLARLPQSQPFALPPELAHRALAAGTRPGAGGLANLCGTPAPRCLNRAPDQ